jgi:glutamyl-Q tRNA(Asp) synthetase
VRGADLFNSTPIQRLLQELLELPQPLYHHHRLILDEDGKRLAKREASTALSILRESGVKPIELKRSLDLIN